MDPRVRPLAEAVRLSSRLFLNCLSGVSDEDALRRPSDRVNSVAFIAAHLVAARAYLTGGLGGDGTDPYAERLGAVNSIDEVKELPDVEDLRRAWDAVTGRLMDRLETLEAADLDADAPAQFPVGDPTALGMLTFLVQHESYHIGQMAILRKFLGYEAMSYAEEEA